MALQHLRASTADKRPTPAAMADGQLAMNTNLASPGLFFKDSNGDLVKTGPVHVGTTAPNATPASGGQAGNSKGELWLDTTGSDYTLKTWDGSAWREIVVTSTMIKDGTIVNADVNASAAIAGTKVSPDFGSQNLVTTGTATAASLNPTGSSVPTNGVYLPATNSVAIATNSTHRVRIDSSGNVGIGTTSPADSSTFGQALDIAGGAGLGAAVYVRADASATNYTAIGQSNSGTSFLLNRANGPMLFYTNNTERARIDSSGRLLVGTSANSGGARIQASGSVQASLAFRVPANNRNGGTCKPIAIETISTDGGTNTATVFGNSRYGTGKWVLLAAFNPSGDAVSATTSVGPGSTFVFCITDAASNFPTS